MKGIGKYHNQKTVVDGITFDSKKEAIRWQELKLMEKAGEIFELKRQVPFILLPSQSDENGKVIERAVKYIADFTYRKRPSGKIVVEDSKGVRTEVYKIKKKIMLYRMGIRITEV